MRRALPLILAFLIPPAVIFPQVANGHANPSVANPSVANPLTGVWSNGSRFIEFAGNGTMRTVLKSYYGFVYEDREWMPYSVSPLEFAPVTPAGEATPAEGSDRTLYTSAGAAPVIAPADVLGVTIMKNELPSTASQSFLLKLHYPKEKRETAIPLAVIGDGMYFRFYQRFASENAVASENAAVRAPAGLDGFWVAAGNVDSLKLYAVEGAQEFYCYYFRGGEYYRIRYWMTDARAKDVKATFAARDGTTLAVPKFILIADALYTCVTGTGKTLRNFESGTFTQSDGALSFKPSAVVFAGTAAAVRTPLKYALSTDGTVLALGDPYLVRSKVADLTAEVKTHNALRRPPRKPIFGFMKLDFHWDEIEKIRNNGKAPGAGL